MKAVIMEEHSQLHLHQHYSAKLFIFAIIHNFQDILESLCTNTVKDTIKKKKMIYNISHSLKNEVKPV